MLHILKDLLHAISAGGILVNQYFKARGNGLFNKAVENHLETLKLSFISWRPFHWAGSRQRTVLRCDGYAKW